MDDTHPQRKTLPPHPSLEHLQKQAKDRARQNPSLKLATAQHRIAREYGFKNWAELSRFVRQLSSAPQKDRPILCEKCGGRKAAVHRSIVMGDKKTEEHFCAECAELLGLASVDSTIIAAPPAPIVATRANRKGPTTRLLEALRELIRAESSSTPIQVADQLRLLLKQTLPTGAHLTPQQEGALVAELWRRISAEVVRSIQADKLMLKRFESEYQKRASALYNELNDLLSVEQRNEFVRQQKHWRRSNSWSPSSA